MIKGMFPKQKIGRPVTHELRKMLNAVFYIVRTGCSWRNLPKDFPNWQAVYTRFRRWKATRLLDKIYKLLTYRLRKLLNKEESGVGTIDSQSVKITDRGGEHGYDGVKKVNGRKRHIVVDNLGYPIEIRVTKADIGDRQVLLELTESLSLKVKKYADMGYQGKRLARHLQVHGVELSMVKRPRKWCWVKANEEAPSLPKFSLLPKRWLVERTFPWLGKKA